MKARVDKAPLQLLLPGRCLGLARLVVLVILFVGTVAAVGATGDGAEHAVVSGIMTGNAADHGALQAALGGGRRGGNERERGDGENGGLGFLFGGTPPWGFRRQQTRRGPGPLRTVTVVPVRLFLARA